MSFVGIDAVVYGATDMAQARRMFVDGGLTKIADRRSGLVFAPDQVTEAWKPSNYRLNRFSEWHLVCLFGFDAQASGNAADKIDFLLEETGEFLR